MNLDAPHRPAVYDPREEFLNALTHGLGAVLALGGGAVLLTLVVLDGATRQLIGAIAFVSSLLLLYLASTLYHAIPHPRAKHFLKILDHCAIYLLIAGTYTPFALIGLRDHGGPALLVLIWSLALIGVFFKLRYTGRFKLLSTLLYVAMGWTALIAIKPMLTELPSDTLIWLFVGGVVYTVGTVFYMSRRLPYAHAIWHLFVLGGSLCHFVAVGQQVLGPMS
jgi:hemolysin III